MRRVRGPGVLVLDPLALLAIAVLIAAGVLNLQAIDRHDLAVHQVVAVVGGLALLLALRRANVRSLPLLGRAAYGTALAMLLTVFIVGAHAYGARRWLVVGTVVIQPSELAKLGLLLVLADVLGAAPVTGRRLLVALGLAAVPMSLTLLQPDLSTSFLLGIVVIATLLGARVRLRAVGALVGSVIVLAPLAVHLLRPYQIVRLNAFLSGTRDSASGWSLLQAHIAIASGGLFGAGRLPVDRLLTEYLPARQTDLAYASLVEQYGLVVGAVVLLAALLLVWRLVAAARVARTRTAALVAIGLATLIGVEAGVSAAGNLGVLPLAGVPFPFLSYGGTAAAAHLAAIGLVLAARRDAVHRHLWTPPRWERKRPRVSRPLAMAMAAQLTVLGTLTWHLQDANGDALRQAGVVQMTRCVPLWSPRGAITDRHGTIVAVDRPVTTVTVTPRLVLDQAGEVDRLATLTQTAAPDLRRLLVARPDDLGVAIADLPADAGQRVAAAGLPGVAVMPAVRRAYPFGELLGPLLGFVGIASPQDMARRPGLAMGSVVGRAGIEREYDDLLRGGDGRSCVLVDPTGTPVQTSDHRDPEPGSALRLTVDVGLQEHATAALASALHGIARQPAGDLGAAVVLDGHTGEVLAMASLPAYDDGAYGPPADLETLSELAHAAGEPMLNHATQVAAPPGSTFKLVAGAADTVYNAIPPPEVIPTGYTFSYGDHTFHGWGPLPPQNLAQAIAWSNDVYFYKLALALGPERIKAVGAQLGAGEPTGIDLPGENTGVLGTPASVKDLGETWWPGASVLLGIGQGYVTATPVQVARWTAAVSTGRLLTPHVGLAFAGGPDAYTRLPQPAGRPLSFGGGLGPVREGMKMAVTQGTATGLGDLPGRTGVGAKTGTAEDPGAPGGSDAWYTAAMPAADPEVVVTVFVHGGGEGNLTSAPVAKSILDYYLAHRAQILATPPAFDPYPNAGW